MTPLLVLQQRLLEVHVSLGDQHGNDPIVLDVSVAVEVTADGLAGLGQLNVEIVQDQHPGELSETWIKNKNGLEHAHTINTSLKQSNSASIQATGRYRSRLAVTQYNMCFFFLLR